MKKVWAFSLKQIAFQSAVLIAALLGAQASLKADTNAPVPAPVGLVSWWPGQANGNDVTFANPATLSSTASYSSALVGLGFYLPNATSYLTVPASPSLNIGTNGTGLTLEAWICVSNVAAFHPIFEWSEGVRGGSTGVQLWLGGVPSDVGALFANVVDVAGNQHQIKSPQNTVAPNQFQHVALTYDPASGLSTLFVNGTVVAQDNIGSLVPLTRYNLYFGTRLGDLPGDWTYGASLGGLLDEPAIYNRALTTNEIAAIYNAGSAGKYLPAVAPAIVSHPTNRTVTVGAATTFTVTATGTAPLQYQWRFQGTNLFGATNASLALANIQLAQAGYYSVRVSNSAGTSYSSNALLTVSNPAPTNTPAPVGLVSWWPGQANGNDVTFANPATLSSTASYSSALVGLGFYLPNATSYLTVPASPSLNIGTNGTGLTLEAWICVSNVAAFHPIFEWSEGVRGGSTGVQLWLGGVPSDVGALFANVVDVAGNQHQIKSPQNTVAPNQFQHVALTYDPASGLSTLFVNGTVVAQDNIGSLVPLTRYNLYFGTRLGDLPGDWTYGASLGGLLDEPAIYNRALTTNEIAAIYNAGSAGKYLPAVAPAIVSHPTNRTVTVGAATTFTVTATGTAPLQYQWRFQGTNLFGATNASLALANIQLAQAGYYSVRVSNSAGTSYSSNALLTVSNPAPTNTPAPVGLVSWWPGQANGNDVTFANPATLSSTASYSSALVGLGFYLPNATSYLTVPASPSLNIGTNGTGLTLEAWICVSNVAAFHPIFEWSEGVRGGSTGVQLWLGGVPSDVGALFANVVDVAGNQHQIKSPQNTVAPNQFQHVALTYDPASGLSTLFVNGTVVAQDNIGSLVPLTRYNLYFGTRLGDLPGDWTYGASLGGLLDEPAIYNRALTTNEIAAIYNAGSAGKYPPPVITNTIVQVPAVYQFTPPSTTNGALVTIMGTNFSPVAASNIVYFGAVRAAVQSATPTRLTVVVPTGATYSPITVTVKGLVAYSRTAFTPTFMGYGVNIGTNLFARRVNLNIASPVASTIADLDGDGRPDLIIASIYSNSISICRNLSSNGMLNATSFAPPVTLQIGNPGKDLLFDVTVADIDGDGKLDLLVPDNSSQRIVVYRNVSTPGMLTTNSFAAPVYFPAAASPRRLAVCDLDGDGHPDLISVNTNRTLSILHHTGITGAITTNSFAIHRDWPLPGNAENVAFGDLDGDRKPDLVVGSSSGYISLFRNQCQVGILSINSFAPRVDIAAPSTIQVTIGDLDGDGRPELIASTYLPQILAVYRNQATPGILTSNSFAAPKNYPLNGRGHSAVLADLNGDRRPDIAAVSELTSSLSVFQNTSIGTNAPLASRVDFAAGWNAWGVAVGDLDGDGRPDVVFGNVYDNTLTIYKNVAPFGSAPVIITQPTNQIVGVGRPVLINVGAIGQPSLHYEWRRNGTVVGTTDTLKLDSASPAQAGVYNVVVTNEVGATVSTNIVLKVITPKLLGAAQLLPNGAFQLTATSADGTPVTETDLSNFEAQFTTNLVDWMTLPNSLSLSNGTLQVQDAGRGSSAVRFYRIIDHTK